MEQDNTTKHVLDKLPIGDVMCRNCKHIIDYDYEYDEDTLWEKPVGKCNNKKSEYFGDRVEANEDNCKHYGT
tara:strand:- start:486 stop:701 length:216 start_codon:yes stop_codon:yes gene_type:complete